MRILHLLTSDAGGAGRAAWRLHQGLVVNGHASYLLVKSKTSNEPSIEAPPCDLNNSDETSFLQRWIQRHYIDANRSEHTNTHYSLGYPGWDISQHPLVQAADIIHLHWVADWLSPISIARLQQLKKSMVWTLHDQRPFTGGCHFSAGCRKYTLDCAQCPQLKIDEFNLARANLRDQASLFDPRAIRIVAPSAWLSACARDSVIFRDFQVNTIPYGLDTEVFKPSPKSDARQMFDLPPEGICLLFGAANAIEKRKGFTRFLEAISLCARDARKPPITLLCFGEPGPGLEKIGLPVRALGHINSDEKLALAYSAADLFILPTLEDNLPNTMLESISCGVPVIAFTTGGVPDVIVDGKNGRLAPLGDTRLLAHAILELASDHETRARMSQQCRALALERFSLQTQARAYENLYREFPISTETSRPAANPQPQILTDLAPNMNQVVKTILASNIDGVPAPVYIREFFYSNRLDELRRASWPWALNPKAWAIRFKRNRYRKQRLARQSRM